jgi:methionine aminopeptidase
MFTRTVSAAIVAGSTLVAPTEASARAGRNKAAVVGAIVGLSGALIAGSAAARSHGYRPHREYRKHGYGGYSRSHQERDCFTRPIMRWNAYYGERVIVGHRRVCR